MSNTTIAANTVVTMHYTLTLDDGSEVDSSVGAEPLAYLHGAGNIVPGLESQMTGKAVGDKFKVDVSPDQGYGQRTDEAVQTVPRSAFPPDADLQDGVRFQAQDGEGNPVMGVIEKVTEDEVRVDFNHLLAGETLHFEIEVVGVRAATEDEVKQGHA